MQVLRALVFTFCCLLFAQDLPAQVTFNYQAPALGSSEKTKRNDLNLELQGINEEKANRSELGGFSTAEYTFSLTTTTPPGSGQVRLNNATPGSATKVYLSYITPNGADLKAIILAGMKNGGRLIIQDKNSSAIAHVFALSADAIDQTTYAELDVTYVSGAGTFLAQRVLVFYGSGSGGGGGGGLSDGNYGDIDVSGSGTVMDLNEVNVEAELESVLDVADLQGYSAVLTEAEAAAAYQPLDGDLTSIAALSTTSYGRGLLTLADAAALAAQVDSSFLTPAEGNAAYQPLDADLTSWALLTRGTGFDTFTTTPTAGNFETLVTGESYGLTDNELACLASVTGAASRLFYFTGASTCSVTVFGASARDLLAETIADDQIAVADSASAYTMRTLPDVTAGNHLTYSTSTNTFGTAADDDIGDGASDFVNLPVTAPIANSSGTITTTMATNRLIGRTTAGTGVMETVTPDATTLVMDATSLRVIDVTCTGCLGTTEIAALAAGDVTTGTFADAQVDGSLESDEVKPTQSFCLALSDETTAITTGTAKVTWRMPYAFTLTGIRGSLNTVSSSGSPIIDVNEAGTSIMTTNKILIDVSEKTSVTAATAPTITDTSLADDAEMTADVDTAGTGAKGLKICLIGNRT